MNIMKKLVFQQQQQQQQQPIFLLLFLLLIITINYTNRKYTSVFVSSFTYNYQYQHRRIVVIKPCTNTLQHNLPTVITSVPSQFRYNYYSTTDNTIVRGRKSLPVSFYTLRMIIKDDNDNYNDDSSTFINIDDSSMNNSSSTIINSYNNYNTYDNNKPDLQWRVPTTTLEIPATTTSTTIAIPEITTTNNAAAATTTTTTAIVLLNIVAIIWGSQHAIIKLVINDTGNPSLFTFVRFAIAALSTTVFLFVSVPKPSVPTIPVSTSESVLSAKATIPNTRFTGRTGSSSNIDVVTMNDNDVNLQLADSDNSTNLINNSTNEIRQLVRWGIEMGIWMFVGFSCQAIGLQYTTAQTSGFLLYLNVKFVPLLSYVLYNKRISISSWISAILAFIGTLLLSNIITMFSSSTGSTVSSIVVDDPTIITTMMMMMTNTNGINNLLGVIWSIAAAIASAMYIIRIAYASKAVTDSGKLNSISLWVVTILSLLWILYDTMTTSTMDINTTTIQYIITSIQELIQDHIIEFLYLSIIATAVSNYIQTKVQTQISAERASIIYSMDPVYGALFSYYILHETFTSIDNWFGTFLILLATTFNIVYDFTNKNNNNNNSSTNKETKNM